MTRNSEVENIGTVQRVKESFVPVNLSDCYIRIAEIAYYKAESRGFEPGCELDGGFEAEQEFLL